MAGPDPDPTLQADSGVQVPRVKAMASRENPLTRVRTRSQRTREQTQAVGDPDTDLTLPDTSVKEPSEPGPDPSPKPTRVEFERRLGEWATCKAKGHAKTAVKQVQGRVARRATWGGPKVRQVGTGRQGRCVR